MRIIITSIFMLIALYAVGISAAASANDGVIIKVGVYENQPKIFTDVQGNVSGFWADIIEYIAAEEGWQIEYVHGTWTECLERLELNEISIMPDVAYSEARDELYDFSHETAYVSWSKVYTQEDSEIQAIPDLEGKTVAVLKGSINVEGPDGIKNLVKAFNVNCTFIETDSYLKVFELVDKKEAEAGVVSKDFAYNHQDEFNVKETAIVFQPAHLFFAFSSGSSLTPYFKERIDYHIKELKEDSKSIYHQSLDKWFGAEAIERRVIPEWAKWLLIGAGGLVFVLAAGSLMLRYQVNRKTKELAEDIIKRKETEKELQVTLLYSRSLIEASLDPLVTIGRTGKITDVNKATEEVTGVSRENLIGSDFSNYFSEPEKAREGYKKVFSEGLVKDYPLTIQHVSGPVTDVLYNASVYRDETGEVQGVFAAARDVTEHKRIEEALQASETKYRRLFEAARDGILILNAETGLIIDVNPFLVEMLGFSHTEFLGKKIWELGLLKDIIANQDAFVELQRKGFVRYEGLPLLTTAGLQLEVEFVSNVYDVDHKKVIQCNIRDITQRKRAEQAKERLDRQLQVKVSELEAFSYGIAHDLKSPLVSIEGFSRLLREDLQNQKAENAQEDIRLLEAGVRKMRDFLNKTLAYSRAEYLIKRTRDVSFNKIANEVIKEFNGQISSIGATVSVAENIPRIYADRVRMAEVLSNLIQNSIKYRDKTVPLKIEIGWYTSENENVFFVRDNGIGIDASEAEKVFTLFYRGTSEDEGSGIGLAIVKKIIEAHGGKIWVHQGQSDKGTTICFTLARQDGVDKGDNNGKDQDTSRR